MPSDDGRTDQVIWCIVVAAGSGTRYGAQKQFQDLGGERVIDRSVRAASSVSSGVVAVVPADGAGLPCVEVPLADRVVVGGETRSDSVRAGLAVLPVDVEVVLVHDAARPLASVELFERVVAAVRGGADAVVPVVAVVDTIRDLDGAVVDRDRLRAVQTPQGFRAGALRSVHESSPDATDDAGLIQAAGGTVVTVEGHRWNLKLTEPADLVVAEAVLAAELLASGPADGGGSPS